MKKYKILDSDKYSFGEYSLTSIRNEDIMSIAKWRNEQIDILRQRKILNEQDQKNYFERIIWTAFDYEYPDQILFSYLNGNTCIGYGGFVHISWEDKRGEVSFLLDTKLTKDEDMYENLFTTFLVIIQQIAFESLKFNRIYTETFDMRPNHISILEKNGFKLEGRLRSQIISMVYFMIL